MSAVEAAVAKTQDGDKAAEPASAASPSAVDTTGSTKKDEMAATFLAFTGQHKKILNTMVRNNPSLLSGSFSVLVHNPNMLEFDNKRSYFFSVRLAGPTRFAGWSEELTSGVARPQRLHDRSHRQRNHYGTLQINVRRQYVCVRA